MLIKDDSMERTYHWLWQEINWHSFTRLVKSVNKHYPILKWQSLCQRDIHDDFDIAQHEKT